MDYESLERKVYRQPSYHYPGEKYAYVFGFTKQGRTFCDGPFSISDSEVDRLLSQLKVGEVFYKDTRNLAAATRQIKADLASRGMEPDEVLKRMLHKKGFEQEKKRQKWNPFRKRFTKEKE